MPPFLIPVFTRAHGHTVTKDHLTQCPDKENFTLKEFVPIIYYTLTLGLLEYMRAQLLMKTSISHIKASPDHFTAAHRGG